ncbi:MAG: sulfite exporter TauE/SafE family protein [Acidimicrobiia bacterium]|nr:sulfite exporter TauE/SafE family protein [Acidimicrobiia bacterium]
MPDLTLILVVVAFSFFVKAIAGFGGPLLAIPLLAPFLGVEHAVVAVAVANIVSNILLLYQNRHGADRTKRLLVKMLVPGAVAAIAGTIALTELSDEILLGLLGASVLVYIVIALRRPDLRVGHERGMRWAIPVGLVGGFVHGATGNSATVFGTFLHSMALPRTDFVFAVTNVFLILSSFQVATLATRGSFTGPRILESLVAVIPVLVVTPLGTRVGRRLDAKNFGRFVLAMLAVAGIRLLLAGFGI